MWVSEESKVVYLALPKTASKTVASWLQGETGCVCIPRGQRKWDTHHECQPITNEHQYFVFTTVRNPYARFVSRFKQSQRYKTDRKYFIDFVRSIRPNHFKKFSSIRGPNHAGKLVLNPPIALPQVRYIDTWQVNFTNTISITYQEKLMSSLASLPFVRRDIKLPLLGKHDNIPWQFFYDDKSIVIKIRDLYQEDFERFGYSEKIE